MGKGRLRWESATKQSGFGIAPQGNARRCAQQWLALMLAASATPSFFVVAPAEAMQLSESLNKLLWRCQLILLLFYSLLYFLLSSTLLAQEKSRFVVKIGLCSLEPGGEKKHNYFIKFLLLEIEVIGMEPGRTKSQLNKSIWVSPGHEHAIEKHRILPSENFHCEH